MKKILFFTALIGIFTVHSHVFAQEDSFYSQNTTDALDDLLKSVTYEAHEVDDYSRPGDVSSYSDYVRSTFDKGGALSEEPGPQSSVRDSGYTGFSPSEEADIEIPHEEVSRHNVKDKVKFLRHEKSLAMPYLNKGYIKQSINKRQVAEKMSFIGGGDKHLQDIIDRAVKSHTPTRAARERISLAKRRILSAVRELFPEAGFDFEIQNGKLTSGRFNSESYKVRLKQPIFRGGVLWNTLQKERAGLRAAEKEYDKIVEDVVRDVSAAYFEYNRTLQVARGGENAVVKMAKYADISAQKFQAELISDIEHLNVESLYSQMKYDNETNKQELELAKLELQMYLGLDNEDALDIAPLYDINKLLDSSRTDTNAQDIYPEDAQQPVPDISNIPSLRDLVDLAYQHRPELQVEAAQLQAARLEERIRWGELLPRADIVLDFGHTGEALDEESIDPSKRRDYRILFEMSWNNVFATSKYEIENSKRAPSVTQFLQGSETTERSEKITVDLFDGLDAFADAKEAEAEKLDQIVELENAEKDVVQSVKQAYFDYQKAIIQMKSTLKRLDYRERVARLKKHRLDTTEIEISEYMQSEIELLQESAELHKALNEYFTAKAKLNHAVGVRDYLPIEETYGE